LGSYFFCFNIPICFFKLIHNNKYNYKILTSEENSVGNNGFGKSFTSNQPQS
jgi:hypothetical protein